jgi:hypothetical protein
MERFGSLNHLPRVSGTCSFARRQVSVGDQIRVTAGFREGKNVFKNNDVAEVREVTNAELVLHDGRRMRRNGVRIDQGVCIT